MTWVKNPQTHMWSIKDYSVLLIDTYGNQDEMGDEVSEMGR